MNPWLSRNLFLYPAIALRGTAVHAKRRAIRRFEGMSPETMAQQQWSFLQRLLVSVYRDNLYYRSLFDRHSVIPELVRTPVEWEQIPFLTKDLIRDNFQRLLSQRTTAIETRSTSGSTGTPLRLYKDREALTCMDAQMYEYYGWYGIEPGTRQARIWGMPFGRFARLRTMAKDRLLNRRRLAAFDLNPAKSRGFFHTLRRFQPYFLYGLINPIAEFCQELTAQGLDPREIGLSCIITTGERQVEAKKRQIEAGFGCRVVDEYGCTELGIIAFECPAGSLHVASHNVFVEIIDPQTGAAAPPASVGEIVLTELHARAMPLIRYRLGDLGRLSNSRCDCGRTTPTLEGIVGRVSDLIHTPSGRRVSCAVFDYSVPASVRRFRAVQHSLNQISLLLETEVLSPETIAQLRRNLHDAIGEDVNLDIRLVERIEREPSGKLRCFVSEIPAGSQVVAGAHEKA